MNLRDLKYLVAVADLKHFSKASIKSNVSQPTLTMQIKKMEDELGVKIFERSNKQVMLTDVGAEIISKARDICREVEEIKQIATSYKNPEETSLIIGAFPTLAPYFLPKAVEKIHQQFAKLKLFLIEEKTDQLIEKLTNGEIDCAFLARGSKFDNDSKLRSITIFTEEFLLALPKNHQLADNKIIDYGHLKDNELLLLDDGHCLRNQALEFCSTIDLHEQQNFKATSLETLRQMVICNSGITLMPEIAVNSYDKIAYRRINNPPKRTIALFFRNGSFKKIILEKIANILQTK